MMRWGWGLLVLSVLFWMVPSAISYEDNLNSFITDVITTFKLVSPTIVYHGNEPEICFKHNWVLCLNVESEHAITSPTETGTRSTNLSSANCFVSSGPGLAKKCIFPFTFRGKTHHACTKQNTPIIINKPWCSTKVDQNGKHVARGGHYGGCSPNCPHEKDPWIKTFADYVLRLYTSGRQDGIIIVGNETHHGWIGKVSARVPMMNQPGAWLVPLLFRSNYPVFMPIKMWNMVELKLDSNILFYEMKDSYCNLIDIFAVNNGGPIRTQFGTWAAGKGLQFSEKENRLERRTDLMGATFINTLRYAGELADFTYDENGRINGSKGWSQELLFHLIGSFNLTVETRDQTILGGLCDHSLERGLADVCSVVQMIAWSPHPRPHEFPIALMQHEQTLLAGVPQGTAPDVWVYFEVFGFNQWSTFLSCLLAISMALPFSYALVRKCSPESEEFHSYESVGMTCLFIIQQGSHPGVEQAASRRVLAITTSILAMLVFIYYSNDITSKMTAGPPPVPVNTFEDVLFHNYKVIIVGNLHFRILMTSKRGSAKEAVYWKYFKEEGKNILNYQKYVQHHYRKDREMRTIDQFIADGGHALPEWYDNTQKNLDHAADQIISDPKTLFYCARECLDNQIVDGRVVPLKMYDTYRVFSSFSLRHNSEYLPLFNHRILKALETGILHRMKKKQDIPMPTPLKIGLTEPEPLGINNVMFPFCLMGAVMFLSLIVAVIENAVELAKILKLKRIRAKWEKSTLKRSMEIGLPPLPLQKE